MSESWCIFVTVSRARLKNVYKSVRVATDFTEGGAFGLLAVVGCGGDDGGGSSSVRLFFFCFCRVDGFWCRWDYRTHTYTHARLGMWCKKIYWNREKNKQTLMIILNCWGARGYFFFFYLAMRQAGKFVVCACFQCVGSYWCWNVLLYR